MDSFLELFNLFRSSKILCFNNTYKNCNKRAELMRLLSNTIVSNRYLQAHEYILTRVAYDLYLTPAWKKKSFHPVVNLTCEQKEFKPLWNFKSAWISLRMLISILWQTKKSLVSHLLIYSEAVIGHCSVSQLFDKI